jgi:pilus assembly protein CpaE
MSLSSPVLAVLPNESDTPFANQVANALGYPYADVVIGSPLEATYTVASRERSPTYIMIDIGSRGRDVLPEIDKLAECCEAGTRVVVIGEINDITFYRSLIQAGVLEYFTRPAQLQDVRAALVFDKSAAGNNSCKIITCISAAAGDGSSTVAMNLAFSLAENYKQRTALVDLDYQFGMIAKNLDLNTQFGIRELFDHPDRGIDATLIRRMAAPYGERLQVISAPNDLKQTPAISPETIRALIHTLKGEFDCVVIDLPHIWANWTSAAISSSTNVVLVAQLWLRSITHAARLLGIWRDMGVDSEAISIIVNRSGAKYKEGITQRDFERVCGHGIDFNLANDIKTAVTAENQGKTILEIGNSPLGMQLQQLAGMLVGLNADGSKIVPKPTASEKGFSSFFKKG